MPSPTPLLDAPPRPVALGLARVDDPCVPAVAPAFPVRFASRALTLVDLLQPPGTVTDPGGPQVTLVNPLDDGAEVRCDFGAGRFRRRVSRHDLFLTAPYSASQVDIGHPHRIRAVVIPLDPRHVPSHARPDFGRLHDQAFQAATLMHLLDRAWTVSRDGTLVSLLEAEGLALLILAQLLAMAQQPPALPHGALAPAQARRLREYIEAHHAQDISIHDLAALTGLSPFHVARGFRKAVGMPPGRYQTGVRMRRAAELLRTSTLTVMEVAVAVGYGSTQALTRQFTGAFGMTPSAYRRDPAR